MALIPNASFEGELAGKQASLTEASLEIHLNARSHLGLTPHDHLYPPHLDIFFFSLRLAELCDPSGDVLGAESVPEHERSSICPQGCQGSISMGKSLLG